MQSVQVCSYILSPHHVIMVMSMLYGTVTMAWTIEALLDPSLEKGNRGMSPEERRKGINVVWYYDGDSREELIMKAAALCAYAKLLGANALAFNIPIYMDGLEGNSVYAGEHTPNVEQVDIVVAVAKSFGFRVTLRPLIDEQSFEGHGRDKINPKNRAQWFSSYSSLLLKYLVQGAADFDQFDIAVELSSLGDDLLWYGVIHEARLVYDGELGWCSNWDAYSLGQTGPDNLDVYGIDFYPRLNLAEDSDIDEIAEAMRAWLATASIGNGNGHKVVLSEVGIAAQAGAYINPADWGVPDKPMAPIIQSRWISAAWGVVSDLDLPGMFVWMLDLNHPIPGWDDTKWSKLPLLIFYSDHAIAWCYGGRFRRM